jgi:hypothetical protein
MSNALEDAQAQVAEAESAVSEADTNVNQAQVELLAAKQGSAKVEIDQAEINVN